MEASQASRDRDNSEKNGSCKVRQANVFIYANDNCIQTFQIFFVLLALVAISMILGAVLLLMWMEIRISMMKDKEDSIREIMFFSLNNSRSSGLVAPSHSYFQRFDKESYFRVQFF